MLDSCALLLSDYPFPGGTSHQAQLTFAMARHVAVDLTLVFGVTPRPPGVDRLPADARATLHAALGHGDVPAGDRLGEIRGLYEPFLDGLADRFLLALPPVAHGGSDADNWQRSAYMARTPGIGRLPAAGRGGGSHFD